MPNIIVTKRILGGGQQDGGYTHFRWMVHNRADGYPSPEFPADTKGYCGTKSLQLYEEVGGSNVVTQVGVAVVSASSFFSGYEASHAFNNNTTANNGWISREDEPYPIWIQAQLSVPVQPVQYGVALYPAGDDEPWYRAFGRFDFEGSADGNDWTLLDSQDLVTADWDNLGLGDVKRFLL